MNMAAAAMNSDDVVEFATTCVDSKPFDVRRLIFAVQRPDVLRGALELLEDWDGDERLRDWVNLRLKVLEVMNFTDRVSSGETEAISKRKKRRATTSEQLRLLPDLEPEAAEPEPLLLPEPVEQVKQAEETPAPANPTAQPAPQEIPQRAPLTDPRPVLVFRPPRKLTPRPMSTFMAACSIALTWTLWLLSKHWNAATSEVRITRSQMRTLAAGPPLNVAAKWGLDHFHASAWSLGSPLETVMAVLELEGRIENRTLTIRERGSPSP